MAQKLQELNLGVSEKKMKSDIIVLLGGQSTQAMAFAYQFGLLGFNVITYSVSPSAYRHSKWIQKELICSLEDFTPERVHNDLVGFNILMIIPMEDDWQISYSSKFFNNSNNIPLPYVNEDQIKMLADKLSLAKLCLKLQIPVPTLYKCNNPNDIKLISYPVILKPRYGTGARGFYIAHNEEQLLLEINSSSRKKDNFFVQKYLDQGSRQFKYSAICWKGKPTSFIIVEKLDYYPLNGGSSVNARPIVNNEIRSYAEKIISYSNWTGFIDFDFIEDIEQQKILILETNPRPPASVGVAFGAGVNFIEEYKAIIESKTPMPEFHYNTANKVVKFQYFSLLVLANINNFFRKLFSINLKVFATQESPSGELYILFLKSIENMKKLITIDFIKDKFGRH